MTLDQEDRALILGMSRENLLRAAEEDEAWAEFLRVHGRQSSPVNAETVAYWLARAEACRHRAEELRDAT